MLFYISTCPISYGLIDWFYTIYQNYSHIQISYYNTTLEKMIT